MTDYSDPDFRAARLEKRYQAEKRFRAYGMAAIITAGMILVFLLTKLMHLELMLLRFVVPAQMIPSTRITTVLHRLRGMGFGMIVMDIVVDITKRGSGV